MGIESEAAGQAVSEALESVDTAIKTIGEKVLTQADGALKAKVNDFQNDIEPVKKPSVRKALNEIRARQKKDFAQPPVVQKSTKPKVRGTR